MFKPGLGILIAIIVVAGLYAVAKKTMPGGQTGGVACTMEAKLCPDGSYVGRSGPNCEFTACPGTSGTSSSTGGSNGGATGTEPSGSSTTDLNTVYIRGQDWPPKLQVVSGPFTCTTAGSATAQAGKTEKRVINGHTYCVTLESEGAAGSTYNQYAYAYEKSGKVDILTFTLQFPQCLNYEDPKKTECVNERNSFNIDQIVDRIAFPEAH